MTTVEVDDADRKLIQLLANCHINLTEVEATQVKYICIAQFRPKAT